MKALMALFLALSLGFGAGGGIEIRLGSENAYKPFAFIDESGAAAGFDNDVVRILGRQIEGAKITISSLPWNAIFSALDAGKIDVVANQITKTKEREEKYIFSQKPYFHDVSTIVSVNPIANITDLRGKKVGVTVGSNHAKNLENYLKNHADLKIQIVYYKTTQSLIADLKVGRIAAMTNNPIAAKNHATAQGFSVFAAPFAFEKTPVFLVFRKDSAALAATMDAALDRALGSGEISRLVERYFGVEYGAFSEIIK